MAYVGMVIDAPDYSGIRIKEVLLPDGKVLENYSMGLDNNVEEEMFFIEQKGHITGKPSDYAMIMITQDGTSKILPDKDVIETFIEEIKAGCTFKVVHKEDIEPDK